MGKVKVGVAGFGVIGQRLADGAARQEDMELVGVADVAPTLPVRALAESGMPYRMFAAAPGAVDALSGAGVPVSGEFDDLLAEVDIMLDAAPGGVGAKNKEKYVERGVKAIFQGGEKGEVADVFFHGYANYEKGLGQNYLKLTSCNTTGLIRTVDCLDRVIGIEKTAITIVRRVADPGDTHRGLVDSLLIEPIPNHQAVDLMNIMPLIPGGQMRDLDAPSCDELRQARRACEQEIPQFRKCEQCRADVIRFPRSDHNHPDPATSDWSTVH